MSYRDAPTGLNGSAPWTDEEKAALKEAVTTYKTRIRPLVRNADLYHILPRPDGKNWDGIQYHDPATGKGVVYLFKPSAVADTIAIKLRCVEPGRRYRATFEDDSNPAVEETGMNSPKDLRSRSRARRFPNWYGSRRSIHEQGDDRKRAKRHEQQPQSRQQPQEEHHFLITRARFDARGLEQGHKHIEQTGIL